MKKTILIVGFVCVSFLFTCLAETENTENSEKPKKKKRVSAYKYETLYRDHIFATLSPNGEEIFFGLGSQAVCREKLGNCMPRPNCIGKDMLYLSKVCYKKDLVCCYNRYPLSVTIGNISMSSKGTYLRISESNATQKVKVDGVLELENLKASDEIKRTENVEGIKELERMERLKVNSDMNNTEIQDTLQAQIDMKIDNKTDGIEDAVKTTVVN